MEFNTYTDDDLLKNKITQCAKEKVDAIDSQIKELYKERDNLIIDMQLNCEHKNVYGTKFQVFCGTYYPKKYVCIECGFHEQGDFPTILKSKNAKTVDENSFSKFVIRPQCKKYSSYYSYYFMPQNGYTTKQLQEFFLKDMRKELFEEIEDSS